jgi:hypothetical protein
MEELEPGRPALGAARQLGEVLRRQRLLVDVEEESLDFPRPEAQVVAA